MAFLAAMLALMTLRQVLTMAKSLESFSLQFSGHLDELPGLAVSIIAFLAVLFLGQMITERRQSEQHILQIQKMDAVGRLASGIAHDFNNVLSIILGYGEVLTEKLDKDNDAREAVAEIVSAAESGQALTRQLLAVARKHPVEIQTVDVNSIIVKLESMLERLLPADIELRVSTCPDSCFVRTDQTQLEQTIINLVVNARDAIKSNGVVEVRTGVAHVSRAAARRLHVKRPGTYVRLGVSDTGVGMDEVTQRKIFEPFFSTKEPDKGSGLGLSTVFGIVTALGGAISVSSRQGEGSRFIVYLPRVDDPADLHETDAG